jgi:hypothetical protein
VKRVIPTAAWRRVLTGAVWVVLCANSSLASGVEATLAAALRERFTALSGEAASNPKLDPFGLPVYLKSAEASDRLEGDVLARIDHPFADVRHALAQSDQWCDILILHLNVKYCRAVRTQTGETLHVGIGRKHPQPLTDVHWVRFGLRVVVNTSDSLAVELLAPEGPMSTHDYRLQVEAAPLSPGTTVLRMQYGYSYGVVARLAMQSYLTTIGRDKVGFSVTGPGNDGRPDRVGGLRGVVERNAMRYFFAIGAYLDTHAPDGRRQMHRSLGLWFDATERYPLQLHEIERGEYIVMKVREIERQQTVFFPPPSG